MKETVLYYTPEPARQSRTLKGILVRMGIRIRNISPQQVNQTVGALAGVPGFEANPAPNPGAGSRSLHDPGGSPRPASVFRAASRRPAPCSSKSKRTHCPEGNRH